MGMKLLLPLTIVCSLFTGGIALAQAPLYTLRGRITDATSQPPLIGATVIVTDLTPALVTTVVDAKGDFALPGVPVGQHDVRI